MREARKAALQLQISITEKTIEKLAPKRGADQMWAGYKVDAAARDRLAALLAQLRSELARF